jgi:iron complex transport system ATP-binding protein
LINCNNVTFTYPGRDVGINNISLSVKKGEWVGVIGSNGSGKSTLLNVISGIIKPDSGSIEFYGRSLASYSKKELAKKMSVLSQHQQFTYAYTVKETIKLGRLVHQSSLFSNWSKDDEIAVQQAMEWTNTKQFEGDFINEISGGERQRVFLAQCLAQESPCILLDEPSNHLDISQTIQILDLLKNLQNEQQKTILTIFHDLNLASLYCDRLIALKDGKLILEGPTDEVLNEEDLYSVFQSPFMVLKHPQTIRKIIAYKSNVLN